MNTGFIDKLSVTLMSWFGVTIGVSVLATLGSPKTPTLIAGVIVLGLLLFRRLSNSKEQEKEEVETVQLSMPQIKNSSDNLYQVPEFRNYISEFSDTIRSLDLRHTEIINKSLANVYLNDVFLGIIENDDRIESRNKKISELVLESIDMQRNLTKRHMSIDKVIIDLSKKAEKSILQRQFEKYIANSVISAPMSTKLELRAMYHFTNDEISVRPLFRDFLGYFLLNKMQLLESRKQRLGLFYFENHKLLEK